jgi:beta-glucosidase
VIVALLLAAAAPSSLTLEEKAAQLQNAAPAEPKLGLPAYDWWSEGLHGIARNGEATVFPQAIGLAATWDEDLMRRVGDVVATEARAKFNARPKGAGSGLFEGLTIWSPNINIFRDPRWGRGQETYGEDPVLTGRLGAAFIRGLQGADPAHPKVIATPKHFVVHSGPEAGRDSFDVDVSPRDLEATYLPAFRMAVTEGKAQSLMCAYNAIHGVPVCASSPLMIDRLRRDWGFTGFTVSDCDAVANIHLFHFSQPDPAHAAAAALKGGTDLNCGSTYSALPSAVRAGLVDEAMLDRSLGRLIAARRALGITADSISPWSRIKPAQVGTPGHRAVALEAARKSIVLLQSTANTLPLGRARIAVVGVDADDLGIIEGNYNGTPIRPVTPLEGIRKRFGAANVSYAQGSVLAENVPVVLPETALRANGKPGLAVQVHDTTGKPIRSGQDRRIDFDYTATAPFRASWTGEFVPPGPGSYKLRLDGPPCWHACPPQHDAIRLWIGNEKRIDGTLGNGPLETDVEGGAAVPIRVEIDHRGDDHGLRLEWIAPSNVQRAEALAAAGNADAIVAVVGLSPDLEGEALPLSVPGFAGGDRTAIELPEPQRELLKSLEATGKPLIVVLTSGSAVALGDIKPAAVLAAWYPGVEGGTALAEILAGDVNPSGRLPVTFYASTADLPAFVDYNMKGRTYRYFAGKPAWGFGHGLSYTQFAYAAPSVSSPSIAAGQTITASVSLMNSGGRSGDEVVQAYLVPPDQGKPGYTDPVLRHMLVGFGRLSLKPGERRSAAFTIDPRLMSSVDRSGTRRVMPGEYKLWIGGGQPGDGAGAWTQFTVTGEAVDLPK